MEVTQKERQAHRDEIRKLLLPWLRSRRRGAAASVAQALVDLLRLDLRCNPSYETLALNTGIHRSNLSDELSYLEDDLKVLVGIPGKSRKTYSFDLPVIRALVADSRRPDVSVDRRRDRDSLGRFTQTSSRRTESRRDDVPREEGEPTVSSESSREDPAVLNGGSSSNPPSILQDLSRVPDQELTPAQQRLLELEQRTRNATLRDGFWVDREDMTVCSDEDFQKAVRDAKLDGALPTLARS